MNVDQRRRPRLDPAGKLRLYHGRVKNDKTTTTTTTTDHEASDRKYEASAIITAQAEFGLGEAELFMEGDTQEYGQYLSLGPVLWLLLFPVVSTRDHKV